MMVAARTTVGRFSLHRRRPLDRSSLASFAPRCSMSGKDRGRTVDRRPSVRPPPPPPENRELRLCSVRPTLDSESL